MRHQRKTAKLGRTQGHRDALLSNLAVSLIEHGRIKSTVAKVKALRPFVEKLVTKAKVGTLHSRRMVLADLRHNENATTKLFTEIGPINAERKGGYTRIVKIGQRRSDASEMAFIEWVDLPASATPAVEVKEEKPAKKAPAKRAPKAKKDEGEA